jgi:hypothetical protein
VAIGLELRLVPGQHVLDLGGSEPAGHVPVPAGNGEQPNPRVR